MAYKKYKLGEKELLILSELRKDSRQSLAEISRKTNIPLSTVFDKLVRLKKAVIKKNISLFDFDKAGYNIQVNFIFKSKDNEIRDFLLNKTNVNSAYIMNKGDFFAECFFRNMSGLERFKDELNGFKIEELREHHIIEEIKKEDFFTKQEHIDMAKKGNADFTR